MSFDPGNAQHPGTRPNQQDAFGFSDPFDREFVRHGGFVAMIADGMGGLSGGAEASCTAVRAFLDAYQQKKPAEDIPRALERSIVAANEAVCARAAGSGTTLIAAVLHDLSLFWISAGDSALFLHHRGGLSLLTNAHVFARSLEMAVARDEIAVSQALGHPDRDCLTSYVGMPRIPEVDRNMAALPLESGDRVLLATDGVYKVLDHTEIAAGIEGSSQENCDRIVQRVLAKADPQQDNITAVMVMARQETIPPEAAITRKIQSTRPPSWRRFLFWRKPQ